MSVLGSVRHTESGGDKTVTVSEMKNGDRSNIEIRGTETFEVIS